MSFRPRSYPHPVLSPFSRDYVDNAEFSGDFERESAGGELIISFDIKLSSLRLDELRADRLATLALDIYSKGSRWKSLMPLPGLAGNVRIPEATVFGTIEVTPVLIATKDSVLELAGINREFSGSRFSVQEGDLLAHGHTYFLESDHHAASPDSESWITFELSDAPGPDAYEIQVANDSIIVFAGKNVMQVIKAMSAETAMRPYLFMSVYKDAFIEAIDSILGQFEMQEEPEEAWAKGLLAFIDSRGLSLDNIPNRDRNSIQQFVLEMVAKDGFEVVAKRINEGLALA